MNDQAIPLQTDSEADITVYRTLLESTKAIPWKIDWKTMQFAYIGPQIEALLGWQQGSWKSADDWAQRMHPEDRDKTVDFCVAQSQAGLDHEADYRAMTVGGDYVWIRDVVHVVRDAAGEVESLIGFMFDISERKKVELELQSLQKKLEEFSFKDGLTGVANRRMLDSVLEQEWSNARRNNQPLSLVMLDIDCFKQYNDLYGHVQGDACLIRVAQALAGAATRGRDFFARFGGEEFVLVLPETDADAAHKIAERCRALIFKEQIPHAGSPVSQLLTLSMGVGSIVPGHKDDPKAFLENIDRRMYRAKEEGRNRIVAGAGLPAAS